MTTQIATYTGKGTNSITEYVKSQSDNFLYGELLHTSGHRAATVTFTVNNGELFLLVNNKPYSNMMEAVRDLAAGSVALTANGSNEDGNAANNVIGNYAIFKHVVFGNTSLAEIVGEDESTPRRVAKTARKSRVVAAASVPAREGVYGKYNFQVVKAIAERFGRDLVTTYLDERNGFTLNDFELAFGTEESGFDLNTYM